MPTWDINQMTTMLKILKTVYGTIPIQVPRNCEGTFEPQLVSKRRRDISGIEEKVLSCMPRE